MKFTISRLNLMTNLSIVSRAVSNKNPNAILTGLKLELKEDGLYVTGSDNDITIVSFIPNELYGEKVIESHKLGLTVLSSRLFLEIIRKIDSEKISIELIDNSVVKIKGNNSDFSLNPMNSENYPVIEMNIEGQEIQISNDLLKQIIQQTSFACSDKETRPILTGVNFKMEGNQLECVATDSYRLARKVLQLKNNAHFNITIPSKNLNDVFHIIEDEESIKMKISDKKVVFQLKNTVVSTRIISGAYPDTARLVPTTFDNVLETISQSLISAIDRASLLSVERNNTVKLSLRPNSVEISSRNQEIGSVIENINQYKYEGNILDISFTSRYFIEAIRAIGTEEIVVLLNGDMKPIIIKNNDDDTIIQLILPVRTY